MRGRYVDLGTMLFYRGYPKDAIRMYRAALDLDKNLYEAWFRIGLVQHRAMEYEDARDAYKKCLKLLKGHGWCNFYLGLLEEQTNHPSKALEYFETAFRHARRSRTRGSTRRSCSPSSRSRPSIKQRARERFSEAYQMAYLEPWQVREVKSRYLPTPTPTPPEPPEPAMTPTPTVRTSAPPRTAPSSSSTGGATGPASGAEAGATTGLVRPRPSRPSTRPTPSPVDESTPYGVRRPSDASGIVGGGVRSVSPEASLAPWWRKLPEWILAFV